MAYTRRTSAILDRDMAVTSVRQLVDAASEALQNLVDEATLALLRCMHQASEDPYADLAALSLYRQIVEHTDATEVLISQCCPAPAITIVRSSFEALLGLEYILQDDASYSSRSIAWIAAYIWHHLDNCNRSDPTTVKGAEFQSALDKDKVLSGVRLSDAKTVSQKRERLMDLLQQPLFRSVTHQYRPDKRRPNWYSLDGGPTTLRELARHVGREAQYLSVYSWWSVSAHAKDPLIALGMTGKGMPGILKLRQPDKIPAITDDAAWILRDATVCVLRRFRPGESFYKWYVQEIDPLLQPIRSASIE